MGNLKDYRLGEEGKTSAGSKFHNLGVSGIKGRTWVWAFQGGQQNGGNGWSTLFAWLGQPRENY